MIDTNFIAEASNGLGYSGNVKIAIEKNGTTISSWEQKNSGTQALFLFFARCIAGSYTDAQAYQPKCIQLQYIEAGKKDTNITKATIYTNTAVTQDAEQYKAVIHFVVPRSSCMVDNKKCNRLLLKNNTGQETLASIDLAAGSEIDVPSMGVNTNIMIDWEMWITNATTTNKKARRR